MSDSTGFVYLAATLIAVVSASTVLYYGVKTRRLLPFGCVLGATAILCALPFRDTYELPWLPGVIVIFFSCIAFCALIEIFGRTRKAPRSTGSLRFGLGSLLGVVFFFSCTFSWIAFVNNSERDRRAATDAINRYRPTFNAGSGTIVFSDNSVNDDSLSRIIPGLVEHRVELRAIDLRRTSVTKKGVAMLKLALPDCEILR